MVKSNTFTINFNADVVLPLSLGHTNNSPLSNPFENDELLDMSTTEFPSTEDEKEGTDEDHSILVIALIGIVFAAIVLIPALIISCRSYR